MTLSLIPSVSKIIVATLLCLKLKTRNLFTLLHFNAHAVTLTPHQWLHSTVMIDMLPSPSDSFLKGSLVLQLSSHMHVFLMPGSKSRFWNDFGMNFRHVLFTSCLIFVSVLKQQKLINAKNVTDQYFYSVSM